MDVNWDCADFFSRWGARMKMDTRLNMSDMTERRKMMITNEEPMRKRSHSSDRFIQSLIKPNFSSLVMDFIAASLFNAWPLVS